MGGFDRPYGIARCEEHARTSSRALGAAYLYRTPAALLLGALALSGCTTLGPDFEPPKAPAPAQWLEASKPKEDPVEATLETEDPTAETPDETAVMAHADWWTVFDDPVLNQLIELAYAQNLTLRQAGVRILEARAQLGIAVGNQYPQSQVGAGSFTTSRASTESGLLNGPIGTVAPAGTTEWSGGLNAAWELDFWGKFRRGIESADANLIASIASYDNVLVLLTSEVATTYVAIRTLEQQLVLARKNVEIQERSLKIVDVRFRNGATTELDVQEATTLLRNTQATIPAFEQSLRQAKNAMSFLLGMPPTDLEYILGGSGAIPTPPAEVVVGVPAELLRRRPDIRQAELAAASQSALIGVAITDLYPSFSLNGSIGLEATDFTNLFNASSAWTGFFSPQLNWNIFNYGRIKNNVRVQDARLQEQLVNYENTVLNAYQEVENAMVAFLQQQLQAKFLGEAVAASQRSVDLALIQYRDGAADYTRVLNTQQALVRDQDNYTSTRGSIVGSLIQMYQALGGGWQIRDGKPFVPAATIEQMRERTDWGKLLEPSAVPEKDDSLDVPPSPPKPTLFRRRPDW